MDSANRTNTIMTLTKEQQAVIVKEFETGTKAMDIKPESKTYKRLHGIYFVGASKTLEAIGYTVPPIWILCLMSGRDIVEECKPKQDGKTTTS